MKTTLAKLNPLMLLIAVAGITSLGLAGCNTTAGIGEDVEAAGSAIEKEAEKRKSY